MTTELGNRKHAHLPRRNFSYLSCHLRIDLSIYGTIQPIGYKLLKTKIHLWYVYSTSRTYIPPRTKLYKRKRKGSCPFRNMLGVMVVVVAVIIQLCLEKKNAVICMHAMFSAVISPPFSHPIRWVGCDLWIPLDTETFFLFDFCFPNRIPLFVITCGFRRVPAHLAPTPVCTHGHISANHFSKYTQFAALIGPSS